MYRFIELQEIPFPFLIQRRMVWEPIENEGELFQQSGEEQNQSVATPCKSCFGRGKNPIKLPSIFALKLPNVIEKVGEVMKLIAAL